MRLSIAGVLALVAVAVPAPVLAQPAPRPARCEVHILRAPEPVRLAIEARVRREPRCETQLVMRIVPTTAGLYLLGHTQSGRTYEMVVPDAETAAELIATWAQRREPAAPPAVPVPQLAPPAIGPPAVEASPAPPGGRVERGAPAPEAARVRPPGVTPEIAPGAPAPAPRGGQWLALAAVAGSNVAGLRGELDILSRSGWFGGVAMAYTGMQLMDVTGTNVLEFGDLRGVVTAGHTLGRGALRLRGQVGIGVMRTQMTGFVDGIGPVSYSGANPIGEAGAHVHLAFGKDRAWALTGGPTLTLYGQRFEMVNDFGMQTAGGRSYDVSFVGGLRRRL